MSHFADLMVRDLTIQRARIITDRYGNDQRDWTHKTETQVSGWVAQRDRSEVLDTRDAAVSDWLVSLPAGTDLQLGDRIYDGETTYKVDGPPNHAWDLDGEHHVEASLRVVSG